MAAHNEYETKKGKGCIGIQYMYHIDKKGKEIVTAALLPENWVSCVLSVAIMIGARVAPEGR